MLITPPLFAFRLMLPMPMRRMIIAMILIAAFIATPCHMMPDSRLPARYHDACLMLPPLIFFALRR